MNKSKKVDVNAKTKKNKDSRNKDWVHDENRKTSKLKQKIDVNKIYKLIDEKKILNKNMYVENNYIDMMRDSNYALANEIKELQKENEIWKNQIKKDKTNIFTVNFNNNIVDQKNLLLDKELESLKLENKMLNEKINNYISQINELELKQKNESFLLIENEHLKQDIARISKLLISTKEYQDLGLQADSTGAIRYLKEIGYFSKLDIWENTKKRGKYHCDACLVEEKYLWVPRTAYNFAHKFSKDFNGNLNETLIEYLLFEINKIFTLREQDIIKSIKLKFSLRLQKLKNKLKNEPKGTLKHALNEIKLLKKDLKIAKKEIIENNYTNSYPKDLNNIEKALKMGANITSYKRQAKKEVEKYKNCCNEFKYKIDNDKINNHYKNLGSKHSLNQTYKIFSTVNNRILNLLNNYRNTNEEIMNGGFNNFKIISEKENFSMDIKDAFNDIEKEFKALICKK